MTTQHKIIKILEEFSNDKQIIYGLCDSEPLSHMEEILKREEVPFTNKDIHKRIDPKLTLPDCKSIIVIGMGYNKKLNYSESAPEKKRGHISLSAVGVDYHITLKSILKDLAEQLLKEVDFNYEIFVDTGPLVERELAKKAGLGFLGKNTSIISKKFGSFFNIGYMLTSLDLEVESGFVDNIPRCKNCNLCVEACPSKALSGEVEDFDYKKCISYLTQTKEELTEAEKKIMGTSFYGCDICQTVCPHNNNTYIGEINDIDDIEIDLEKFLGMDKREFKEKYSGRGFFWRGKKILDRNCLIILENLFRNT